MYKLSKKIPILIAAVFFTTFPVTVTGCSGNGDTTSSPGSSSPASTIVTAQDRAALLAAQSQLRNAQTAQNQYFAEHERYASSTNELKSIDARLNPNLEVNSGGANGYEMQITANDSRKTVLVLRQTGSRIERVDGEGNPW